MKFLALNSDFSNSSLNPLV